MSDGLASTPDLAEHWCPACDTTRDPLKGIVIEHWCYLHAPEVGGPDDTLTGESHRLSGTGDSDGADCRAIAKLLRRRRKGIRT